MKNNRDSETAGGGTTDGMIALRPLVEKGLEMQGRIVVGCVDMEKAYDTVPTKFGFHRHACMVWRQWR